MQPLLDSPPPVHAYAQGIVGPAGGGRARRRARQVARPVGGLMTDRQDDTSPRARRRHRRSRRSPTTRSCRTATPAPSSRPTARSTGCACRASTRRACSAPCSTARPAGSESAPFGINVPTARIYEPGTNIVATTWKTPTGWILVRDALTMGPTRGEDEITPHTRPPADDDADHMLVRTVLCLEGEVEVELVCEPDFDYGRTPAEWSLVGDDRHTADATAGDLTIRLRTDMALGIEGDWVRARHALKQGEQAYCALSWAEELAVPQDVDEANARMAATVRYWRGWLNRARLPDHRWRDPVQRSALAIKGLTYMPTGATVAARDHLAARDARRRAQLGLPLHLDPRLDLHPPGAALPQPGLGGRRVHAVHRRPRAERRRRAPDHVRDRRAARPHRVDPRRPVGLRGAEPVRIGNGAFDQRQNDVFGAALDSILLHTRRSQRLPRRLWPIVESQAECATAGVAQPRPGHLGGPRGAAALRVVEADVLGRARPRGQAGPDPRRPASWWRPGARPPRRSRRTSSSTACATASCASTTRPTRSTPRRCSPRCSGSCPATTSACARASRRSPTT